jgi:acetyl-CoA acyltransferase
MTKQLQDAYIVAATRTPIGKAPRGMFRNVRPDDLLVRAIQAAVSQVPALDVKLIEDSIVGCSFLKPNRASTWRAWRCCWPACRSRSPA